MPIRRRVDEVGDDKSVVMGGFRILPVNATVIKATPKPEVVRVRIMKRFILNRDNHSTQLFDPKESNCGMPGYYDVSPKDAANPYLQAFTDKPPPVTAQPGTLMFAEQEYRRIRQRNMQEAILKQQENDAIADVRRQNLADLRERMGGDRSGIEDPRT